VRKTIKRVGEELLDDPAIGPEFMQPLKMRACPTAIASAMHRRRAREGAEP
jgi:hypothetical protein